MIYFKFSEKPQRSEINEAYMHILVQETGSLHNITNYNTEDQFTINIQVNRITFNSQRKKASVTYTNISKKLSKRELTEGRWVKVNVTNMVLEYLLAKEELDSLQAGDQRDNLTVTVKIQDPEERISFNHSPDSNFWMPYIEIRVSDSAHKRTRRTIGMDCKEGAKEVRCCRYPLIVDFEEFGWDFIIAPKQYRAYYCGGDCPYSYLQQYPHTHLVHLVEPPGSNGPCCSPKKVSGITMLYFDHDMNIIYGNVPGMVVESCGCS